MAPDAPRVIARLVEYDALRAALAARFAELGMSREVIEERTGLAHGSTSAMLAPPGLSSQRGWQRTIGLLSLEPLLTVGCAELWLVARPDLEEKYKKWLGTRMETGNAVRDARGLDARGHKFSNGTTFTPEIAKVMAARWLLKTSPTKRKRIARVAAKARWSKRDQPRWPTPQRKRQTKSTTRPSVR